MLNAKNETNDEINIRKAKYFIEHIASDPEIKQHFSGKIKKPREVYNEVYNETVIKTYDQIRGGKVKDFNGGEPLLTELDFKRYFYRSLMNNYYAYSKPDHKNIEISEYYAQQNDDDFEFDEYIESPDELTESEIFFNNQIKKNEIQHIITLMDEPHKSIMHDRVNLKMKYKDIASKNNWCLQTVKNRIRAAKLIIQKKYQIIYGS